MARIFKLVLVIAVLVVAWKVAGPRLLEKVPAAGGDAAVGSDEGAGCVRAARRARDVYGSGLGALRPGEPATDFRGELDAAVDAARSACGCSAPGCSEGRRATDVLAAGADEIAGGRIADAAAGGAHRLQEVDDLLDAASAASSY